MPKVPLYNVDSPGKLLRFPSLLSFTSTVTSSANSVASLGELRSTPSLRSISTVTDYATAASTAESLSSPDSRFPSTVTRYIEPTTFISPRFKPHPDDFIILILGLTGSGMTNFINKLTGEAEQRSAQGIVSDTMRVNPHCVTYQGLRLVLVDTPGFDATYRSDSVTLRMIADWLIQKYPDGTMLKIGGIIYLHRITDSCMTGSAIKNLQMLGRICGDIFLHRMLLVTTMWDYGKDLARAEERETELKFDFWKSLIDGGATVHRFRNTSESAQDIVMSLLSLGNGGDVLLLQEELGEQQKRLNETQAGKVLYSRFPKKQKTTLRLRGGGERAKRPGVGPEFAG